MTQGELQENLINDLRGKNISKLNLAAYKKKEIFNLG